MSQRPVGGENDDDVRRLHADARYMAEQLALGFRAHDRGLREEAIDCFQLVDELQFQYLSEEDAHLAATAFVDALWAKDEVEFQCLRDGDIQVDDVLNADYGPVRRKLRQRATIIGASAEYAIQKTEAWRRHKAGGDYWTPFGRSQVHELRAALRDPTYPNKPRAGGSGLGPEPLRYVLALELHDMHTDECWEEGLEVMTPYFLKILRSYENDES